MFNQNQKLLAETFEGRQLKAKSTSLINQQGETMNLNLNQPKGNQKLLIVFKLYKDNQVFVAIKLKAVYMLKVKVVIAFVLKKNCKN